MMIQRRSNDDPKAFQSVPTEEEKLLEANVFAECCLSYSKIVKIVQDALIFPKSFLCMGAASIPEYLCCLEKNN